MLSRLFDDFGDLKGNPALLTKKRIDANHNAVENTILHLKFTTALSRTSTQARSFKENSDLITKIHEALLNGDESAPEGATAEWIEQNAIDLSADVIVKYAPELYMELYKAVAKNALDDAKGAMEEESENEVVVTKEGR